MKRDHGFHTILWIASIAFTCTRYLCASIMCAGALGDHGTYQQALDTLGPFLPVMSLLCLFGALLLTSTELIAIIRSRNNGKNK